jgi:hypothetical protein
MQHLSTQNAHEVEGPLNEHHEDGRCFDSLVVEITKTTERGGGESIVIDIKQC